VKPIIRPNNATATAIARIASVLRSGLPASAARTSHAYLIRFVFFRDAERRVAIQ
jgi:hypothetical protein